MKNAQGCECGLTPTVLEAIEWAQAQCRTNIDLKTIMSRQRYAHLVRIRRLAMWCLRTKGRKSFPWIAKAMRMADHATVIHHVQRENAARGLPKDYPLSVWRAEQDTTIELNIDLMESQVSAGQNIQDVAYQWGLSASRLSRALAVYRRRKDARNSDPHNVENQRADGIAPVFEGARA